MEPQDAEAWREKYGSGPLPYGTSAQQGPRETMEDYVTVIQKGRCGFLYAGSSSLLRHTLVGAPLCAYHCRGYLHAAHFAVVALLSASIDLCIAGDTPDVFCWAAGVFDGHQGPGAAAYLHQHLYTVVSEVIQDAADKDNSGAAGEFCATFSST